MKLQALPILTLGLLVSVASVSGQPSPSTTNTTNSAPKTDYSKIFKTDKEKFGYALGMSWGVGLKGRLKGQDVESEIDMDSFAKGFLDNVASDKSLLTEAQEKELVTEFSTMMRAKAEEKRKEAADKNLKEGEALLAKNKTAPGVVTLPSGLQYKVLVEGKGESPKLTDEVSVNYRGTLIDGTEFDSSYKRGQPFNTRVQGGIIKGWTEALQLMKPGSKWQLFIPPSLAYGPSGAGRAIGPNETLIFEIELISAKPAPVAASAPHAPAAPLTSDIIKVPSAEEMKKGAKIETIKAEDLEKEKAKANQ